MVARNILKVVAKQPVAKYLTVFLNFFLTLEKIYKNHFSYWENPNTRIYFEKLAYILHFVPFSSSL